MSTDIHLVTEPCQTLDIQIDVVLRIQAPLRQVATHPHTNTSISHVCVLLIVKPASTVWHALGWAKIIFLCCQKKTPSANKLRKTLYAKYASKEPLGVNLDKNRVATLSRSYLTWYFSNESFLEHSTRFKPCATLAYQVISKSFTCKNK